MPSGKSSHVRLLDVARACGLSVSTVSIVLSEAPLSQYVAASTREQIRAMAQQLGYHPDAYARSLRRRRSHTIGVVAFDLSDPFCIPIVRGIQDGLGPASYLPLLMDAQARRDLFDSYLQMILERRAEGLIVIASWIFNESNLLVDVKKNNVPLVILARDLTERGISSVQVDNHAGGMLAMRHLYGLGHRQIAVIRGPEELFDSEPRWAGVRTFSAQVGLKIDPKLVFQLPNSAGPTSGFDGGVEFSKQILASQRPFSAVVAFDDLTALGVIRGFTDAGLKIPQDCSVLGFDDVLPAAVTTPGLTTIHQPLREMGMIAARWALDAVEARELGTSPTLLSHHAEPELVVRESTAAPASVVKKKRAPAISCPV
jgi:DNA-binding LacI/PurR family transcriptional regulator